MLEINLEKIIEPGSLRWLGQNYNSLSPQQTVIAGKSIKAIADALGYTCYQIGRINIKNAFVAYNSKDIFYIYVSPTYTNYRNIFKRIINGIDDRHHIDHVLAKNLAVHLQYRYVMICMVQDKVNIKHGRFEKIKQRLDTASEVPDVCYADDRIFDKIMSRNPMARRTLEDIITGYKYDSSPTSGLTLKQAGIWNSAFGFDKIDKTSVVTKLKEINLS